jgi:hypothetical protein
MGKKGRLAQVLPVKMQQVEAIEEQPLRVMPDRLLQRLEVGDPSLILNDHLTIEYG